MEETQGNHLERNKKWQPFMSLQQQQQQQHPCHQSNTNERIHYVISATVITQVIVLFAQSVKRRGTLPITIEAWHLQY